MYKRNVELIQLKLTVPPLYINSTHRLNKLAISRKHIAVITRLIRLRVKSSLSTPVSTKRLSSVQRLPSPTFTGSCCIFLRRPTTKTKSNNWKIAFSRLIFPTRTRTKMGIPCHLKSTCTLPRPAELHLHCWSPGQVSIPVVVVAVVVSHRQS